MRADGYDCPPATMTNAAALVALHVAVALFGFAGLFGKWLTLSPVAIVLGRTAIAAAALGILRLRAREHAPFDVRLAANGIVLAVHWVSFFAAIQVSTVAVGLLGFASFPLFVLVLDTLLSGRRWSAREGITAGAVTLGLVILVPSFAWQDRTVQGLGWGVLSGFTFALLAVRGRLLVATHAAAAIALWQNAFAALLLVPVVVVGGGLAQLPDRRDAALLVVLGLVCTALAHTLFIDSMRRVTAHVASVVAALEPVYGILLAWLLLGERPGMRTLAGGVLIVGAALFASSAEADEA